MKIDNIETQKDHVHPLILEIYEKSSQNTPNDLMSLFKSDCAVCAHALVQVYPDRNDYSIECVLTARNLTHEMYTDENGKIAFENILSSSHIRCTQCQKRER